MSERFTKVPESDARSYVARKSAIHRQAHKNFDKNWSNISKEPKSLPRQLKRNESLRIIPTAYEVERKNIEDGAFLAGLFEARGLMNIYKKENVRKLPSGNSYLAVTTNPILTYHDSREFKMKKLQERFGGNYKKVKDKNSYRCSLEGHHAVEQAQKMLKFTNKRSEMAYAFINWANSTKEERLVLVEELGKSSEGADILDEHSYFDVLDNPSFAAGVFEAGGAIEWHDGPRSSSRSVRISTANSALLEATESKWEGKIVEYHPNSKFLKLGVNESEKLLEKITPYLVSSLEEYRHTDVNG